jgi:SAM-dependent methyltransferase
MRRFSADYLRRTREGLWDDREALADLHLHECDSVLDVGCGTGELTGVLAEESGGRVVGCDRDPDLLAHLPAGVDRVRGDALALPLPDDAVDLVVCQALLVNLPDPAAAAREFTRVARERVAVVEPDNGAVTVESTVDAEPALARRARERYVAGVDADVALGEDAADVLRAAGLEDVQVRRRDHDRVVEPPYSEAELSAVARKASGAALRESRDEMAGSEEALDALRSDWRTMGRTALEQVRDGDYRRREVVPFYVAVGSV